MLPSLDAREASNKRRHGVRKARARLGCSHHAGSCPPGHRSPLSPMSPWRCGGPAAPTARPFTTGMRMLLRRTECRSVSQSHLLPVGVVGICPKISYGYQARLDPNVSGTSGEFGSPTRMCRGVLSWELSSLGSSAHAATIHCARPDARDPVSTYTERWRVYAPVGIRLIPACQTGGTSFCICV